MRRFRDLATDGRSEFGEDGFDLDLVLRSGDFLGEADGSYEVDFWIGVGGALCVLFGFDDDFGGVFGFETLLRFDVVFVFVSVSALDVFLCGGVVVSFFGRLLIGEMLCVAVAVGDSEL